MLNCPLRQAAISSPNAPAICDANRSLTFDEFDRLVTSIAHEFEQQGVRTGSHVAILSGNSIEYVAVLMALIRIGALCVPLNTRLHSVELKRQLNQIDFAMVLTDEANQQTASELHPRTISISDLINSAPKGIVTRDPIDIQPSRDCVVVFTSGSSGTAKGVRLSFGNLHYSALGSNENLPLAPGDTWLLSLPLFHVGGLGIVFRCLLAGAQIFVSRRFDTQELNNLIDAGTVTHLSLVPSMLTQLLRERNGRGFAKLPKAILLGGAPVSESLLRTIRELRLPVIVSYGMTETASQVTATKLGDPLEILATSGRALPYREIRIESGPGSAVGEICVRGKVFCLGYTGDANLPLTDDNWFRTGDIGTIDADGFLTVLGRKDGMFISGGENIFPEEIERLAAGLPGVTAAAVIAIDNADWGKRPVLFIESANINSIAERDIVEFLSDQLAKFKLPDRIIVLVQLPRTTLDKIDRAALEQLAKS